jgi:hypothetical protein
MPATLQQGVGRPLEQLQTSDHLTTVRNLFDER